MGCAASEPFVSAVDVHGHIRYFSPHLPLEGSLGIVRTVHYRAKVRSGDSCRIFALKVQHVDDSNLALQDSRNRMSDARREFKVWQRVGKHPNVVEIFDRLSNGAVDALALERFGEGILSLEHMHIDESKLLCVFRDMLRGVAHVNGNAVAHCDVKLENFLVSSTCPDVVQLTGFSVARAMPFWGYLSGTVGTPIYMSPEMVDGRAYGFKTDVWSIGVALYRTLYGCFPYWPDDCGGLPVQVPSAGDVRRAIRAGEPRPTFKPEEGWTPPPEYAMGFVRSLLERRTADRPSAKEALTKLELVDGRSDLYSSCSYGEVSEISTCSGVTSEMAANYIPCVR